MCLDCRRLSWSEREGGKARPCAPRSLGSFTKPSAHCRRRDKPLRVRRRIGSPAGNLVGITSPQGSARARLSSCQSAPAGRDQAFKECLTLPRRTQGQAERAGPIAVSEPNLTRDGPVRQPVGSSVASSSDAICRSTRNRRKTAATASSSINVRTSAGSMRTTVALYLRNVRLHIGFHGQNVAARPARLLMPSGRQSRWSQR